MLRIGKHSWLLPLFEIRVWSLRETKKLPRAQLFSLDLGFYMFTFCPFNHCVFNLRWIQFSWENEQELQNEEPSDTLN